MKSYEVLCIKDKGKFKVLHVWWIYMEAIGFLSLIFQWGLICDMDLKRMLQMSVGCMEAIGFLSVFFIGTWTAIWI